MFHFPTDAAPQVFLETNSLNNETVFPLLYKTELTPSVILSAQSWSNPSRKSLQENCLLFNEIKFAYGTPETNYQTIVKMNIHVNCVVVK